MTTTDFSQPPAGADYWLGQSLNAVRDGYELAARVYYAAADKLDVIDRLSEEECPMDEIDEAAWLEAEAAAATLAHFRTCALGIGPHPIEECPR